jgi:hypothetical protein
VPAESLSVAVQGGAAVRDGMFDAFVSYSHAAGGALAPAVRRGLQQLTNAWYQRRALNVYLDRTGQDSTAWRRTAESG